MRRVTNAAAVRSASTATRNVPAPKTRSRSDGFVQPASAGNVGGGSEVGWWPFLKGPEGVSSLSCGSPKAPWCSLNHRGKSIARRVPIIVGETAAQNDDRCKWPLNMVLRIFAGFRTSVRTRLDGPNWLVILAIPADQSCNLAQWRPGRNARRGCEPVSRRPCPSTVPGDCSRPVNSR